MSHSSLQHYDYHVWANEKFFGHLKELREDIYQNEVDSVFPSISDVFAHMYLVDNLWLGAMSGKAFDEIRKSIGRWTEETKDKNVQEMESMFANLSREYRAFLEGREDLDKETVIEHPQFGSLKAPLSELVRHVVNHGTYHRGNITAMLRQLGQKGASTDYIFYLYEKSTAE